MYACLILARTNVVTDAHKKYLNIRLNLTRELYVLIVLIMYLGLMLLAIRKGLM